ncbi:MAG: DUF2264 domain-containing protein [Lawsonibacter sp.]|nr:DUF2264 domain-containing protein [Lawsonibacter sp.]
MVLSHGITHTAPPLRTRADVERALLQLLEPVKDRFTEGNAGLHLGDFAVHYGERSARMEAFSRMLWGLAPLWSQGGGLKYLPLFREGLANGTDLEHPAYWGPVAGCDQKIVEMDAIATTLMLCGGRLAPSEREARFAQDYLYWFEDGGRAVPFGRSLTYRFGQCAFFSALSFAGVEALPWGVVKSRVLGNLRDWFAQPIFSSDCLLTVGYGYPNLCVGENYNAPGSPYWALKAFLCLALPEEHPFWRAEEEIPSLDPLRSLPKARMLIARPGGQVQLFPAGQSCVCQLGQVGPKYEKLVYSSRFGFSVPRGDSLEEGAFDSCLAVSEAGEDRWRTQRGFDAFQVGENYTWRRFSPMRGVTVEVTVAPCFPSHRREYRITTDRPISAPSSAPRRPSPEC